MRPLILIVGEITDVFEERKAAASKGLREEAAEFRKRVADASEVAAQMVRNPTAALRNGTPLQDLRRLTKDISLAKEDIKIFESVIDTIVAEIPPIEKPYVKATDAVLHVVDAVGINKSRYLVAKASGDPGATTYRDAFVNNLRSLVNRLNEQEIPVPLIKELRESLEYIEVPTLNEEEA